jgi:hypothetical protein
MKLYLVTSDDITYDDHDAVLVRASSPAEAKAIVQGRTKPEKNDSCVMHWNDINKPLHGFEPRIGRTITAREIKTDGPTEIIIGCGHAG